LGVENLASFIAHRLIHSGGKVEVFLVADDEQVSTPEFVRRVEMAMGRRRGSRKSKHDAAGIWVRSAKS